MKPFHTNYRIVSENGEESIREVHYDENMKVTYITPTPLVLTTKGYIRGLAYSVAEALDKETIEI